MCKLFSSQLLLSKGNHAPDILGLCGRIHKDIFIDSGYADCKSRDEALKWYASSFLLHSLAFVNLFTGKGI